MKSCLTCINLQIETYKLTERYVCGGIPNCDLSANVTTMDDEGGQFATLLIKNPAKFGCSYHQSNVIDDVVNLQ